MFYADEPDHWEDRAAALELPREPTVPASDRKGWVANPAEKNARAVLVEGNLPRTAEGGVHTMDDVVLDAIGPGSERVHGFMDNTEVFRVMAGGARARPCIGLTCSTSGGGHRRGEEMSDRRASLSSVGRRPGI